MNHLIFANKSLFGLLCIFQKHEWVWDESELLIMYHPIYRCTKSKSAENVIYLNNVALSESFTYLTTLRICRFSVTLPEMVQQIHSNAMFSSAQKRLVEIIIYNMQRIYCEYCKKSRKNDIQQILQSSVKYCLKQQNDKLHFAVSSYGVICVIEYTHQCVHVQCIFLTQKITWLHARHYLLLLISGR